MYRSEIVDLISSAYRDLVPVERRQETIDERTRLFGGNAALDSIQLLTLLIEIEQRINDRYGTAVSLVDDRAMSQERSPFRSIESVAEYVNTLLREQEQEQSR